MHWANPALEKKEANKRGHQCELCPATYKEKKELHRHIRREHDGESAVARRGRMEAERRARQNVVLPFDLGRDVGYGCGICNRRFISQQERDRH